MTSNEERPWTSFGAFCSRLACRCQGGGVRVGRTGEIARTRGRFWGRIKRMTVPAVNLAFIPKKENAQHFLRAVRRRLAALTADDGGAHTHLSHATPVEDGARS